MMGVDKAGRDYVPADIVDYVCFRRFFAILSPGGDSVCSDGDPSVSNLLVAVDQEFPMRS